MFIIQQFIANKIYSMYVCICIVIDIDLTSKCVLIHKKKKQIFIGRILFIWRFKIFRKSSYIYNFLVAAKYEWFECIGYMPDKNHLHLIYRLSMFSHIHKL